MQPQDPHQHQDGAGHRVEDKLHRRVDAPLVSPDADEEVHRKQHHFPEEEEEKQVERQKDSDNPGFQHQQHQEKFFYALVDARPGCQDRNRGQKGGQQDEEQTDAVHAQVVIDGRVFDPGVKFFQPVSARSHPHAGNQQKRQRKFRERGGQRQAPDPHVVVAAKQQQRQRSQRRQKRDSGQQVHVRQISFPFPAAA